MSQHPDFAAEAARVRHTAARAAGGLLNVTLTAECEEEIGRERPAPERERPPAEVTLPQ